MAFFTEVNQKIMMFICKHKRPRVTLSDFTYTKVIKTCTLLETQPVMWSSTMKMN